MPPDIQSHFLRNKADPEGVFFRQTVRHPVLRFARVAVEQEQGGHRLFLFCFPLVIGNEHLEGCLAAQGFGKIFNAIICHGNAPFGGG